MSMPTPRRANVSRISCRASQQWLRFICRQQLDHCEALDLVMSARAMSTFNLVVTIYTTSSAPFPEAQEIHGVWNSWWGTNSNQADKIVLPVGSPYGNAILPSLDSCRQFLFRFYPHKPHQDNQSSLHLSQCFLLLLVNTPP